MDIVQKMGETKQLAELVKHNKIKGNTETKLLYEESDEDWLKLQGKDRKKYGKSKEMKIGIAYDGIIHHTTKNEKIRKELDGKVAYASFESASDFKMHKEAEDRSQSDKLKELYHYYKENFNALSGIMNEV